MVFTHTVYLTEIKSSFLLQRTSLGATLLSPVSQLALGTIGRSRSLINQSQESLDPGDHYDHSDREDGEEQHQQDADDEDDSGLVGLYYYSVALESYSNVTID